MPLKLFDTILKMQGYDIQRAQKLFKSLLDVNDHAIEERKQAIVQHHLRTNGFYKSLVTNEDVAWNELPVLTKRNLQQPLVQRLSSGYHLNNVFKGKTSGSSGHPFTFAKDKFAHALTWAAFHHAYNGHNINLNTSLQARFYGIPLNGKSRHVELLKDFVSYRKRFAVFNLNAAVLDDYVSRFCQRKYQYINGYTSSIVLLAKHCASKNIVLKDLCPSLALCIVTSEMLFPDDRELLEKWLGVPVVNEYGASEVGLIAMENSNGNFELNNQNLFVEVVDNRNIPVANGATGRILVTDLYNLAHPMIRYEIGDLGSIQTLENGMRIISNLQGRTSDIAQLPSGKIVPGLTFYYVTKAIIHENLDILEFVVIQREPALFEIQYVSATEMTVALKAKIQQSMDTYLEPGLQVAYTRLEVLDRSSRGKLKQFVNELQR